MISDVVQTNAAVQITSTDAPAAPLAYEALMQQLKGIQEGSSPSLNSRVLDESASSKMFVAVNKAIGISKANFLPWQQRFTSRLDTHEITLADVPHGVMWSIDSFLRPVIALKHTGKEGKETVTLIAVQYSPEDQGERLVVIGKVSTLIELIVESDEFESFLRDKTLQILTAKMTLAPQIETLPALEVVSPKEEPPELLQHLKEIRDGRAASLQVESLGQSPLAQVFASLHKAAGISNENFLPWQERFNPTSQQDTHALTPTDLPHLQGVMWTIDPWKRPVILFRHVETDLKNNQKTYISYLTSNEPEKLILIKNESRALGFFINYLSVSDFEVFLVDKSTKIGPFTLNI